MNVIAFIVLVLFLAFVIESLVEYFVGEVANHIPRVEPYKWLTMYLAAIVGIVAAFIYQLDLVHLLADFLGIQMAISTLGMVLTGLAIGRGSNFIHDIWKKFFLNPTPTATDLDYPIG